jgi:hypothetical protein
MRRDERYFQVVIELTGFTRNFDCLEEACEYAEELARDIGAGIVVAEIHPRASDAFERYQPIFLYEDGEVRCLRD